ncbi:MAG: hypothetical protein JNJ83_14010 [Verrucomicrobiaceae bacterium]|nr:hypothetical protein [Verrucomicrobiaceae bacterium]
MTVVAAAEVISCFHSHDDMEVLEVQWGIAGRCGATSKSARVASLARIALEEAPTVITQSGRVSLSRALVEKAITAPERHRDSATWKKLIAGLRFDGFEIITEKVGTQSLFSWGQTATEPISALVRMLPETIPGTDFRDAESEVVMLLDRNGFRTAKGHLVRAISAFQRGEWSGANGELRNFYESYLNEMAEGLGDTSAADSKAKRDYLGTLQPPFLLSEYNEWNANNQKPQFVQGLLSRMHPHGGHPGLSEEEDATFRLQISLVTARLFLRRYDQRKNP